MHGFALPVTEPLNYVFTGKFEAPSKNWSHEALPLGEFELFVMTEGTLYLTYNKEFYTVPAGSCLLLPPVPEPNNQRKGFQPSDCAFYWLHFSCRGEYSVIASRAANTPASEYSLEACSSSDKDTSEKDGSGDITDNRPLTGSGHIAPVYLRIPVQAVLPEPEKVVVLMKQLQDGIRSSCSCISLDYMTTVVLCEIDSQLSSSRNSGTGKRSQKQTYFDILDYIHLNLRLQLKVSDIAAEFGYNEKYLSHLFSTAAGIPLKQYILTQKINMASFFLSDTNKPVSQIAYELGYTDTHNFSTLYRKIVGLSPSEYRNAYAKRLLYHK